VTGYLDSAAKGRGQTGQRGHGERYAVAEDYMQVVYKLWEGSWAEDAVVADVKKCMFTRPDRVRRARHDGLHYKLDALHLSEPSPQRTPVLHQAGTSPAGRSFAARHAECVFKYVDPEGALTLMSGWTGVDFSEFDPDQIVEHMERDAGRTAMENITRADRSRRWTVREVAEHVSIGGIGPLVVGSPATVADQLESWIEETDLDGFNLAFIVRPETFVDVVDLLVPELQRRGRYKTAYEKGTLREKLFGAARLGPEHPAAEHRWL
jgi:alkanesulfonate monooxygenase